jgi:hypothetical protein
MNIRFRVWMPPIAVLIVLVTVSLVFVYGIPAAKQRLEQRTESLTLAQAAATADAITGEEYQAWQELMQIRNIREKIEPDPKNPRYVLTARGIGYKFAEI